MIAIFQKKIRREKWSSILKTALHKRGQSFSAFPLRTQNIAANYEIYRHTCFASHQHRVCMVLTEKHVYPFFLHTERKPSKIKTL